MYRYLVKYTRKHGHKDFSVRGGEPFFHEECEEYIYHPLKYRHDMQAAMRKIILKEFKKELKQKYPDSYDKLKCINVVIYKVEER